VQGFLAKAYATKVQLPNVFAHILVGTVALHGFLLEISSGAMLPA
jgi:hypothetical protein